LPHCEINDGKAIGEITNASDHFGNIGISIPNEMIKEIGINNGDFARVVISKNDTVLFDKEMLFHKSFGYVDVGEMILNECSNDYVEISINQGSFCDKYLPEVLKAYDLSEYKVEISPAKR